MNSKLSFPVLCAVCWLSVSPPVHAQWLSQSFSLRSGWNAIYLHVHPDHATLDELIGGDPQHPIQEVWLWQPTLSTREFTVSPQVPTSTGTQWANWSRTLGPSSFLRRLMGNSAYLVRVSSSVTSFTWTLKGKAVPPRYEWTSTGLNFLGFPTAPVNPPSFETFLSPAPSFAQDVKVYGYVGGDLGPNNPQRILAFRTLPVRRGEAFWMRSETAFNRYFGPFELSLQDANGVSFGDTLTQYRLRLRNRTASNLTVSLRLMASETPPAGQPAIVASPPLLLKTGLGEKITDTDDLYFATSDHHWLGSTNTPLGSTNTTLIFDAANQELDVALTGDGAVGLGQSYFGNFVLGHRYRATLTVRNKVGGDLAWRISGSGELIANLTAGGDYTHEFTVTTGGFTGLEIAGHAGDSFSIDDVSLRQIGGPISSDLTDSFTRLGLTAESWTLEPEGYPGSGVDVVLGIDRSRMTSTTGAFYAGLLRFTDALGYSQVDVPVSAKVASPSGLWVGGAAVTQVRAAVTNYVKGANGSVVTSTQGQPVIAGVNTTLGGVAQSFPLRLILHHSQAEKKTVLLQRVYFGSGLVTNEFSTDWYVNPVVAKTETSLDRKGILNAYRISAAHLPFSADNKSWNFTGELKVGTNLTATVTLPYDDQASNPFLHTYHPDHDNLNATYDGSLPQGQESYGISRQITLTLMPPGNDFASLTRSTKTLEGVYAETITLSARGSEFRRLEVQGVFSLSRVTDIPTLSP